MGSKNSKLSVIWQIFCFDLGVLIEGDIKQGLDSTSMAARDNKLQHIYSENEGNFQGIGL